MTKKLQAVIITLTVIGAVVPASAGQYANEDQASKFGIRVVNFIPLSSRLRSQRSMWMGPAIDWNLSLDNQNRPSSYLTFGNVSSSSQGSEKASLLPLSYTRISRNTLSPTQTSYFGYGAGISRAKVNLWRTDSKTHFPTLINGSAFLPGAQLFYGREFNNAYFAEIQLSLLPKWKGDNWSGISLNVGTRFGM